MYLSGSFLFTHHCDFTDNLSTAITFVRVLGCQVFYMRLSRRTVQHTCTPAMQSLLLMDAPTLLGNAAQLCSSHSRVCTSYDQRPKVVQLVMIAVACETMCNRPSACARSITNCTYLSAIQSMQAVRRCVANARAKWAGAYFLRNETWQEIRPAKRISCSQAPHKSSDDVQSPLQQNERILFLAPTAPSLNGLYMLPAVPSSNSMPRHQDPAQKFIEPPREGACSMLLPMKPLHAYHTTHPTPSQFMTACYSISRP